MNFKISKISKVLVVSILVFSFFCFSFSVALAGVVTKVLTAVMEVVATVIDFVICTVVDDVLGVTDCDGGGVGAPADDPPGNPPCEPVWTPSPSEYCIGEEFTQDDGCGLTRVVEGTEDCNQVPLASNLDVSVGNTATYCGGAATHYFSWTYSDSDNDNQSRFQFQVDNNSDFGSPTINRDYSGLSNPSPTTNTQTTIVAVSPGSDQIAYNTTYYWRVKVYDSNGSDSDWVSGSNFATEKHRYPSVDFNWSPQEPSEGEDVLFADQSTVYGGVVKSSWSWTFENSDPNSSAEQNPLVQFTQDGANEVVLRVTDSDGYFCSKSQIVNVQWSLPGWKEILPW